MQKGLIKRVYDMKAQELRIGNLVNYNGKVVKVEQITKHKIGYHTKPNETRMNYARLCEVEPIPITKEMLLKIGFKKNSFGWWRLDKRNDKFMIKGYSQLSTFEYWNEVHNPEDVTEVNYGSTIELPYKIHLHTLQNIWHLLTGKELEIEL